MSEGVVLATGPCARCGRIFEFPIEGIGDWWPSVVTDGATGQPVSADGPMPADPVRRPLDIACARAVEAERHDLGLPEAWGPFWAKAKAEGSRWLRA